MKAILEQIRPPNAHSFAASHFSSPRFNCPYHYHPEIELTLILAGHGQRLIGSQLANFDVGDLVLMGSGLPHSYFHPPGFHDRPRGARSIVLHFLPDFAGNLISATPECRSVRRLLERARRGLSFSSTTRQRVSQLMKEIVNAENLQRMILFLEILQTLVNDRSAKPLNPDALHPKLNELQSRRIEQVCAWISQHFCERITLDQAARIAHLTPPAFSRFFRRATNRPFIQFLNELRIGHASYLLLETEKPIAEIGFESGFENLSNFNRHFLRVQKVTPRQYRTAQMAER